MSAQYPIKKYHRFVISQRKILYAYFVSEHIKLIYVTQSLSPRNASLLSKVLVYALIVYWHARKCRSATQSSNVENATRSTTPAFVMPLSPTQCHHRRNPHLIKHSLPCMTSTPLSAFYMSICLLKTAISAGLITVEGHLLLMKKRNTPSLPRNLLTNCNFNPLNSFSFILVHKFLFPDN